VLFNTLALFSTFKYNRNKRSCLTTSWLFLCSKMINLSQPDTIDERVINTKKITPFTMTVSALTFEIQQRGDIRMKICENLSNNG